MLFNPAVRVARATVWAFPVGGLTLSASAVAWVITHRTLTRRPGSSFASNVNSANEPGAPCGPVGPGEGGVALAAGPPSPDGAAAQAVVIVPANVEMLPVLWSTRRIALSPLSAISTLPDPSTATPAGLLSVALVAAPPSPHGATAHAVLCVLAIVQIVNPLTG